MLLFIKLASSSLNILTFIKIIEIQKSAQPISFHLKFKMYSGKKCELLGNLTQTDIQLYSGSSLAVPSPLHCLDVIKTLQVF